MKSIIAFYTKAKAHLQLSDFYDACAQVLQPWRRPSRKRAKFRIAEKVNMYPIFSR